MGFSGFLKKYYGNFLKVFVVVLFTLTVCCVGLMVYVANEIELNSGVYSLSQLDEVFQIAFWLFWVFVGLFGIVLFPLLVKKFGWRNEYP